MDEKKYKLSLDGNIIFGDDGIKKGNKKYSYSKITDLSAQKHARRGTLTFNLDTGLAVKRLCQITFKKDNLDEMEQLYQYILDKKVEEKGTKLLNRREAIITNGKLNYKYALDELEIRNYIENGLLPRNCITIVKTYPNQYSLQELQEQGFRIIITNYDCNSAHKNNTENVFITDFFLIYYDKPKENSLIVVPLEYVEECSINFKKSFEGYIKGNITEVKKSPIKGALIGSTIAGKTGAIVGAVANSSTNIENARGSFYNTKEYDLNLKLKEKSAYISKSYIKINGDGKYISDRNSEILDLIARANNGLSNEEKRKIIIETNQKIEKQKNEIIENHQKKFFWKIIIFFGALITIGLIYCFCNS